MVAPALLFAGGMAAGGLASMFGSKKGNSNADKYYAEALKQFQGINAPSVEEMKIQLQDLVLQGQLTPEQAQAILLERTAYEDVPQSDEGMEAEMDALSKIRAISEGGGLTAQDRANIADIQDRIGQERRGEREAIMQNAAARGVGGSGLELANQLMSSQEAATTASKQGLDVAALAEQRALEAIREQGALGGQVSEQKYGRAAKLAEAKDAIDRFNAANRQNIELTNVDARNRAQAVNLGEKQRIADANVGQTNLNRERNSNLLQQEFENKMGLAKAKAGIYSSQADTEEARKKSEEEWRRQMAGGLIGGGGQILASYAGRK